MTGRPCGVWSGTETQTDSSQAPADRAERLYPLPSQQPAGSADWASQCSHIYSETKKEVRKYLKEEHKSELAGSYLA
jgi:hypothetical protein